MACAQLCLQCGWRQGVCAEIVQSVLCPCLSTCSSPCLPPAACVAPMPAASACPVRWPQHIKASNLTAWGSSPQPHPGTRLCRPLRLFLFVCFIWRHLWFKKKKEKDLPLWTTYLKVIFLEKGAQKLFFILHPSTVTVLVCVYVCIISVCEQKPAPYWRRCVFMGVVKSMVSFASPF